VETLAFLQNRVSISKVRLPAPNNEILKEVFKACGRAADHGSLKPWRFLVIEGAGLVALSNLFVAAASLDNPSVSPSVLDKCKNMTNRAPMIIVAIARCAPHPKIPKQEQIIACGAAVQNMLNAFFVLGFGAIWRSGEMTQSLHVRAELGVSNEEEIIGFVYVGTPIEEAAKPAFVDVEALFKVWPAE
jgi:nitroreductase